MGLTNRLQYFAAILNNGFLPPERTLDGGKVFFIWHPPFAQDQPGVLLKDAHLSPEGRACWLFGYLFFNDAIPQIHSYKLEG